MKSLSIFLLTISILTGVASADTVTTQLPTSGEIKSEIPAATTGTAPIDSNTPSGTGTTGTSGVTLDEAAENDEDDSSLIYVGLAALATIIIVMYVKKRKNPKV